MKILIIGGSYFLGRVLTMLSSTKFELTLVNRGRYSMKQFGVKEYFFDRHDIDEWKKLPKEEYDAVVDLCAYQVGDIKKVIQGYKGIIRHYIFISTVDVYEHQVGEKYKDESYCLENRHFQGEIGEYIYQKVQLERELRDIEKVYHIPYTSIRPGNIYGPFNYAPRESEFIKYIVQGLPLIIPSDATATFQLVYVEDVARAIILVIENKVYNKVYNIVSPQCVYYQDIYACLKKCHQKVQMIEQPIQKILEIGYALPYPLTLEEMELYNGEAICKELGLEYTSLEDGIKKTYQAFLPVFKK